MNRICFWCDLAPKQKMKKLTLIWTIAGFCVNQIFAYFPVWSSCIPNSGDPPLSGWIGSGWCAPLRWKLLLFTFKHHEECQEFNCVRHWETCNLRVTWPAGSHRRGPVERAEGCRAGTSPGTGGARKETKLRSNALLLQWVDLVRLVDYNLSSVRAQQSIQSGPSQQLLRKRRRETEPRCAKPFPRVCNKKHYF